MNKVAVGQHHFIRSFLPALVAALMGSALVLLGFGLLMERELNTMANRLAQRVTPASHVAAQSTSRSEISCCKRCSWRKVATSTTSTEAKIASTRPRAPTTAGRTPRNVETFTDMEPMVARFEERVAAANAHDAQIDAAEMSGALDEISDALRTNRAVATAGATKELETIGSWQRRRRGRRWA